MAREARAVGPSSLGRQSDWSVHRTEVLGTPLGMTVAHTKVRPGGRGLAGVGLFFLLVLASQVLGI